MRCATSPIADIQAWVHTLSTDPTARHRKASVLDEQRQGLSAARVIQAYQVVDQVLSYAVRSRYLALNPGDGVQLPRKTTAEKFALTHDQVRALADAAGDLRTAVYVLAYGGLRYGELAAMRVGDVDVTRRRLKVSRSATVVRARRRAERVVGNRRGGLPAGRGAGVRRLGHDRRRALRAVSRSADCAWSACRTASRRSDRLRAGTADGRDSNPARGFTTITHARHNRRVQLPRILHASSSASPSSCATLL